MTQNDKSFKSDKVTSANYANFDSGFINNHGHSL